jgi:cyclopropane-fatty-acyl-phospholipid synthase
MSVGTNLAERGLVPDWMVRRHVRRQLRELLEKERRREASDGDDRLRAFLDGMRSSPIAVHVERANVQHYEVPAELFRLVLGPWKKYSCCYWPRGIDTLEYAEEEMLDLTCRRAGIEDGMHVLDLGCGWGSLSRWTAARYPGCRVTAVSNSISQRRSIEEDCRRYGLLNVEVVTADVAAWDAARRFDRIVSVEMMEHMRNWEALLAKTAGWLEPDGKLFVHVFTHRRYAYTFDEGPENWMGNEFFSGGMMPSDDLIYRFPDLFQVEDHQRVSGTHYARTLRAWLDRLDANRDRVLEVLEKTYGPEEAVRHLNRWRLFFLACEESFAYRGGREWQVSHYLLGRS